MKKASRKLWGGDSTFKEKPTYMARVSELRGRVKEEDSGQRKTKYKKAARDAYTFMKNSVR